MKVKMFVSSNPAQSEKELNEWLSLNPVNIVHITQSQSEKGGNFIFVVSVFFDIKRVKTGELGLHSAKENFEPLEQLNVTHV